MTRVEIDRQWHVRLASEHALPVDARCAWRSLREFARFACMDMFHRRVVTAGDPVRRGTPFVLEHGLFGIRLTRVGKILHWHEGRSYAFSDLSRRGARKGFPHVYVYTLLPGGPASCRIRVEVRGRWTARFLGRAITRAWLALLLIKTSIAIRNGILFDVGLDAPAPWA